MTRDGLLGWLVLLSLFAAASAGLLLPLLRRLGRAAPLRRLRWPLRGMAIALGAAALWYATPLLVSALYRGV
jgi:hypothetical protein